MTDHHAWNGLYGQCRALLGHAWEEMAVEVEGRIIHVTTTCARCSTTRTTTYRLNGERVTGAYHYPENYLAKGSGGLDKASIRHQIFVNEFRAPRK